MRTVLRLSFAMLAVVLVPRLDLYNALNTSAIQTYNQAFTLNGAWLTPTAIMPARFAKLTAQLDF